MTAASTPSAPSPPQAAWHALDGAAVAQALQSDMTRGLSAAEAARRLAAHGANTLPEPPPRPAWHVLLQQFRSPLIYILFVAALIALALGHYGDAAVILAVVAVNAAIGAAQEGRAERSMAALRQLSALRVRVRRDGAETEVAARELVPGDLLALAAGDAVGADARLVDAAQCRAAEAALTGESVPVAKSTSPVPEATGLADRHDMLYSGTYVTGGRALALVVATGAHTEVGRIAGLTEGAADQRTPLERRIERFGRWLVGASLVLFVAVMLLGLWRGLPAVEVLMVAISQMVSVVPEGLPVAVTIALAVGMQRMASRGAVIRRLSAVETLGSTTVICSDKTGTLTRNEMTVTRLWWPEGAAGLRADVAGSGYAPEGAISRDGAPAAGPALTALAEAAALCNDATLRQAADGRWSVAGDPTEGALCTLAAKAGVDVAEVRAAAPRLAELPFDADRQLMATLHDDGRGGARLLVKGAPEAVLKLLPPGEAVAAARAEAEALAGGALRVLAFAAADGLPADASPEPEAHAGRLRLLGLAGQIDPPREEARAAVAACHAAGVRVVMVTGDHRLTGLAIARALGIAGPDDRAVDGPTLERLGEAELRDGIAHIAVFARVQPAQKLRIVEALQAGGEVVAMTGDGVNDAPALARADVGVAMGITGTEVAKSAARIVVTDDDFATIVGAVEQGRVVYGNLKKVILYLFATSLDEVALLLLALGGGQPLPLLAVQILWINIVTEGTLTVNLVMDPPDGDEMRRPPTPRDEPLVDRAMLGRIALMATTAVAVTYGWYATRVGAGLPIEQVRTETFTLMAMCQWFNVLNCQSRWRSVFSLGWLRNPWLAGGLALGIALQVAVVHWAPLGALFHTVALPAATWGTLAVLASAVLWVEEARKLLARLRGGPRRAAHSSN
ncbi:cation-translocating P-type ATPase [Rubrivivax gelatinosus]|uniref:Calcium-transporting ATPase n=1 Tax=Rubrivivax gelatinosus (strain NBRC 100245 / IL144) TaxID=983917 RepID=I0HR95_RUBGI|nr:HAD-IC family P-type ATPase [Rubrivivax gelatinosus]BAL95532.1 calcium-transporting ATPase [Rubrivivax gelatinosus IL144]